MAALTPGSELLKQYFGAENLGDVPFVAEGPTYADLQNAYLYPDNETIVSDPDAMNGKQSRDMREGLRLFMWELAVTYASDESDPNISINIPTSLLQQGLSRIVQSEGVRDSLTDSQVAALFNAAQELQQGKPGQAVLTVLGVAMGAIGMAVPVVGWIGALVVGLAKGITAIVQKRNAADMADDAARTAALYRSFPPLQTADSEMDGEVVQSMRSRLKFHDWTDIWAPRFSGEWAGVNRDGGFAFAQGGTTEGPQLGQSAQLFEATGGIGVIPGTSEVTAVIQVSLETNPDLYPENAAWQAFINGGQDPRGIDLNGVRGYTRVTDTGIYYPATGRLAASLWEMLSNTKDYGIHGNPYLYRVDCRRLHPAWQEWAEAGLRYIREVCYPWYEEHLNPNWAPGKDEPKINAPLDINGPYPGKNMVGFMGTAIYNSIGVWAATVAGGSSTKPKYLVYPRPAGTLGSQLSADPKAYGWPKSSMSSSYSGGFLPILDPDDWFDGGMGERYHRGPGGESIELTLNKLQSLQAWSLRHTLVSAYCSERDAAFAGPANATSLDNLRRIRKVMLESEDRYYIDINDVPRNEPALPGYPGMNGLAKDWRDQLIKSGVPAVPKQPDKNGLKLSASQIDLPDPGPAIPCEAGVWCPGQPEPGPMTFVPGNADPWEPQTPKRRGVVRGVGSSGGFGAVAAGVGFTALLGTGLVMAARARMKPRRSFSARR